VNDHTNEVGQITPAPTSDRQEGKKIGLPKPPLFTSDYITMAEILQFAMERFGQLVLALMYYTTDGTIPDDLPPDLNMMFGIYQRKVDAAREKYKNKCAVNAENGSKGGKKKAENAKAAGSVPKFKGPTLAQFREAVKHFIGEGSVQEDTESYEIDKFFDGLQASKWTICGEPIQRRSDWEAAIREKFTAYGTDGVPQHWHYLIFSEIFSKFHGLRNSSGESQAETVESDFMDTYDQELRCWIINGEQFSLSEREKGLAQFMKQYSDFSDT